MDVKAMHNVGDEKRPISICRQIARAAANMSLDMAHCPKHRVVALLALIAWMASSPLLLPTAAAETAKTFDDGRRAYDFGNYASAETIWTALAQSGDARSQSSLGYLYREGKGVRQNVSLAAAWYYRAAMHGEPTAQAALCAMHLKGEAVSRNLKAALFWCELSIEGGENNGIALREHVLNQISLADRDAAWDMVTKWHAVREHETCCKVIGEMPAASANTSGGALASDAGNRPNNAR